MSNADRRMISTNIYECSIAWRLGSLHPGLLGIAAQRIIEILIFLADDFGRGRYIPAQFRLRAFATTPEAFDKITEKQIEDWVQVMVDEGAVEIYEVNNQKYYSLTGWEHYQRGNWRPRNSNIPAPETISKAKVLDTKRNKSGISKDGSKEVLGVTKRIEEKRIEEKRIEENRNKEGEHTSDGSGKDNEKVYSSEITEFVTGWFDGKLNSKEFKAQCDAVDKLIRIDGFPFDEISSILNWVKSGEDDNAVFWRGVTHSFVSLRKTKDGRKCHKYLNLKSGYKKSTGSNTRPAGLGYDGMKTGEIKL